MAVGDEGSPKLSFSNTGPLCHQPEHTMMGERGLYSGKTLLLMLCPRPARLSVRWLSWEGRRPGSGICPLVCPVPFDRSSLGFRLPSSHLVSCEEDENAGRGKARQPGLMGFKAWLPLSAWEGACVPVPAGVGAAGGTISICCHLLRHRGQGLGQPLPELRYISNISTSPALGTAPNPPPRHVAQQKPVLL